MQISLPDGKRLLLTKRSCNHASFIIKKIVSPADAYNQQRRNLMVVVMECS
jgi:hypothetical protein